MRRINFILLFSIAVLIISGILFVKANRHESTIKIIEDLRSKDIVFYSSNYKRAYINNKNVSVGDMDKLCIEGSNNMKSSGLSAVYYKIDEGTNDPYTLSKAYLDKHLSKDKDYILVDISRGQTRHGSKYKSQKGDLSPISIILSNKSKCYEQSLLFAGRVKAIIDKKYVDLPVHIITMESMEYNQSKGYIGMLIEIGDAANSYDEAKNSLDILCEAMKEVISIER